MMCSVFRYKIMLSYSYLNNFNSSSEDIESICSSERSLECCSVFIPGRHVLHPPLLVEDLGGRQGEDASDAAQLTHPG